MDKLIIKIPKPAREEKAVLRIYPDTYRKLQQIRKETGQPLGPLANQCIEFALERLEIQVEED